MSYYCAKLLVVCLVESRKPRKRNLYDYPFVRVGVVPGSDLAFSLDVIVKYSVYVLLNAGLVFAVAVPIYLRKKWWASLTEPKSR